MIERLLAGLAVSLLVAALGWRARTLSTSGATVAVVVGTAIAVGASWPGILVLGAFFVSSSCVSRIRPDNQIAEKGSRRDAVQVLSNGGIAALAALVAGSIDARLGLAVVAGSLAAATADTWATELGQLSGANPRLLVSRREVQAGESGGVTSAGLMASVGGAMLVAAVAGVSGALWLGPGVGPAIFVVVLNAGVVGSIVDSLAGELIQERRYCVQCHQLTEARTHGCGMASVHRSGVQGITNDAVNVLCTLTGAAMGAMILLF